MENKTSKYIKYAIGEIVLVVLGILIALRINNWNENIKKEAKEKAILKELHKDFTENLKQFNKIKVIHINTLANSLQFRKYIHKKDVFAAKDSIAKYYFKAFNGAKFKPSNGVIESLISSGEYQLIKNDTLRKYIISWKDILNDYIEDEYYMRELWSDKIEPYLIEEGDLVNLANPKNLELVTTTKFKNLTERQILYVRNIVNTVKNKPLEEYLKGIVRLSKTE
ncbi:DUF6090 family protein [Tenacibaculum amylolyticum]|uniref:DUF6090 family protein n=1 Tax=Tenacibaculum amylolyticum TaxID=104269 RepID=UPI00389598AC